MSLNSTITNLGNAIINLVNTRSKTDLSNITTDGENVIKSLAGGSGASRNIGEIVTNTVPITDAGLHLLDGALIDGSGSYADFVDYMEDIFLQGRTLYDPTYITKTGNVNITSDGIASGFSTTKYINFVSTSAIPFTSSATLNIEITPSSITSTGNMDFVGNNFTQGLALRQVNDELRGFISTNGTSWTSGNFLICNGLKAGTSYNIKVIFTATGCQIYVNGDLKYTNTNGKLYNLPYMVGLGTFSGTIDLKKLTYIIDGVVYSGGEIPNTFVAPTTVTTYNYQNVGNIINNDGVLSNFYDKIRHAIIPSKTPTTSMELVLKIKASALTVNQSITEASASTKGIVLRIANATTGQINAYVGAGSWFISNVSTGIMLSANTWTYIKMTWNGSTYSFASSTDGTTWTSGASVASKTTAPYLADNLYLGGCTWEAYPFTTGSIDLNGCYLNIDGERYWTGSTTSSLTAQQNWERIVSKYGNCEKFVYDSTNNTVRLPKIVEDHHLIATATEGGAWYRIYSDGWCEQGGSFAISTNSNYTVYFPKEFIDTNYTVSVNPSDQSGAAFAGCEHGWGEKSTKSVVLMKQEGYAVAGNAMDWTASGYINISDYGIDTEYNYICISSTTKTDIQVDIDEIATDLASKVDKADLQEVHCVVETYSDDTSWYRIYSDGWVEQGGTFGDVYSAYTARTFTFLVPFKNVSYTAGCHSSSDGDIYYSGISAKTQSSITFVNTYNKFGAGSWYAFGYKEV